MNSKWPVALPKSGWPDETATERLDHSRHLEKDPSAKGEEISSKQQSNKTGKDTGTGRADKSQQRRKEEIKDQDRRLWSTVVNGLCLRRDDGHK